MEKLIAYVNANNKVNMELIASTPQTYVNAIKAANISLPTQYNDLFPFSEKSEDFWSGFYSSRPTIKKQVKDGSANFHATSKLFSEKVIQPNTTNEEIAQIKDLTHGYLDVMGLFQHHDAVSGTEAQHVANDYSYRMMRAMTNSNALYTRLLEEEMLQQTGVKANSGLSWCLGAQNDTILDCPITDGTNKDVPEFIVVAHNP